MASDRTEVVLPAPDAGVGVIDKTTADGDWVVETTRPPSELRHDISDMELTVVHAGGKHTREADRAFQIFWSALSVAAGAAPQVARDFWNKFFASQVVEYDVFAVWALFIFAGAVAVAVVHYLFWWKDDEPSSADLLVKEIRERTNRTRRVVRAMEAQATSPRTEQTT